MGRSSQTLESIELFQEVDGSERGRVEASCRWRRYRTGQTILDQGSQSRNVYFVVEGAVRITNCSLSGREVAFATVRAGDYFGEYAAIDGLPRSASAITVEDALLAIAPAGVFVALLEGNAAVAVQVLRKIVKVVRTCDERIMDLSTMGAMQRVYSELLRVAVPDAAVPDLWVVRPVPPMREIASRVSTTRETAARAVSRLLQSSVVSRKDKNLYILDRRRLEQTIEAMDNSI